LVSKEASWLFFIHFSLFPKLIEQLPKSGGLDQKLALAKFVTCATLLFLDYKAKVLGALLSDNEALDIAMGRVSSEQIKKANETYAVAVAGHASESNIEEAGKARDKAIKAARDTAEGLHVLAKFANFEDLQGDN